MKDNSPVATTHERYGPIRITLKAAEKAGFKTAIDDFGAGYAGLNMLAAFQPDYIKLDMELTRNVDQDVVRKPPSPASPRPAAR